MYKTFVIKGIVQIRASDKKVIKILDKLLI